MKEKKEKKPFYKKWWVILIGIFIVLGIISNLSGKANFDEANNLWTSGSKAEAVTIYRSLVSTQSHVIDAQDLPQVFERILTFEGDNGNTVVIKKTLTLARQKSVSLSMDNLPPAVKTVWESLQVEAVKQKQLENERNAQKQQQTELARQAQARKQAEAAIPIEQKIPWITRIVELCQKYRDAPNEIKKSAVFNKSESFLKKQRIKVAKGTIEEISTSQGGSGLHLEISIGDVTFRTPAFSAIKKGTKVYKQVAELAENQCAIFSATKIESFGLTEKGKLCDQDDFYAKFTDVKPCTN